MPAAIATSCNHLWDLGDGERSDDGARAERSAEMDVFCSCRNHDVQPIPSTRNSRLHCPPPARRTGHTLGVLPCLHTMDSMGLQTHLRRRQLPFPSSPRVVGGRPSRITTVPLRIRPTPCWLAALRLPQPQIEERVVGLGHFRSAGAEVSLIPFHGFSPVQNISASFSHSQNCKFST